MPGGKRKKKNGDDEFTKDRKLPEKVKLTSATENPEVKKRKNPKVPPKSKAPVSSKIIVSPDLTQDLSLTTYKLSSKVTNSNFLEKENLKSAKFSSKPEIAPSTSSQTAQFSLHQLPPVQNMFVVSEVPSPKTITQNVEID